MTKWLKDMIRKNRTVACPTCGAEVGATCRVLVTQGSIKVERLVVEGCRARQIAASR